MMKWIKGSVLVCAVVAVLGVASQASAGKREGGPPAGFMDQGPAVVGSLTFANGTTVVVDASCKGTPITLVVPHTYDLQALTAEQGVAGIEGFTVSIEGTNITPEMIHCYPDLASVPALTVVVNTVTKFKAIPPAPAPRTTVIADVVLMRRIAK